MPKTQKIHKYEIIHRGGYEIHKRNGLRHRDNDLPAVIRDGNCEWCQKGKLHRDGDQPARVYPKFCLNPSMILLGYCQEWYQHGKLHRNNDLPAIVRYNGYQEWYQHGQLHRDGDLPARIYGDGYQEWYRHGQLHREGDLPACIYADGNQEWHQHDRTAIFDSGGGTVYFYKNGECYKTDSLRGFKEKQQKEERIRLRLMVMMMYNRRILKIPYDIVRCELVPYI